MSQPVVLYPSKPDKVYLFGTCLVDLFYPEAGLAGVELLEREGIEVIYPQDQTCCGQPAYTSGRSDEARAVARTQLDLFPEDWPVVVPSGSCAGMVRHQYPKLFAGTEDAARAEKLAARVWDLADFLVNVCHIKLADTGEPVTIALHTSCSSRREMGVADSGPALLRQLNNVTLVEPAKVTECCGFGGSFAVRHADISGAMANDKVAALAQTGCDRFLSTDCGCLMNISGVAEKQQKALPGEHLLSFLWQRTQPNREA
ncbi:MAG TPA: (Fe-S)-binding protein [Saccharospirillum sp.]|nr:(Fe-S)-binding protein [Saccharospirillum sp.]